ncbi:MAG TPA: TonB-dependent receptor [Candidatus Aquilonibacter sp.]|nr:TonB-dependent receptor [Candidatus Aquilonibacter sp.]
MACAQGTSLSGVVRDSTGAAITAAHVELKAGSHSSQTVTDSSGAFSFTGIPDTSGTVSVTAKGFAQVDQDWSAANGTPAPLTIILQPSAVNQQVIVTADRTQTRLSDSPASDIVLSQDTLQNTAALTVDDKLRQVPGFSLFRRSSSRIANPTTLGVSLRGLGSGSGSSRALVLEDGVPLNDPFGSWVYWDRVPEAAISSVEVAQEGASSLYGSEALSGVIQFLTRQPTPAGLSIETSYGTENTPDLSLWAGGEKGGWFSTFGGEVFQTDGYYLVPEEDRGTIDTRANSAHGTADLTVGRKFGSQGQDEIFVRGLYFDDSRNNGTPYQTNSIRMGQSVIGANLQLGNFGSLTLRSYGVFETYHQGFSSVGAGRDSETPTDQQTVPAEGIGESAVWTRSAGSRQTLVAGFDEHEEIGRSDEILFSAKKDTSAGGRQRTFGLFGEDIIELAPRWLLTLSGRYDHWSNFNASLYSLPFSSETPTVTPYANRSYDAFDPRATLLHQFNDHISWSTSVYRAFRAPTLNELYRSFRQGTTTTDANSALRAERLTGVETGVDVHTLNQRLELRGVFFFNYVINPVSNVPCTGADAPPPCILASSGSTQVRENLGRTMAPGFEIDAVTNITQHIQLSTGYQYVNATILSSPGIAPSLANTWVAQVPHQNITFQATYANPRILTVSFDGRMVGKQYDTTGNSNLMGGYFVLDATASRSIGGGVQLFAAAENMLDRGYLFSLSGGPELGLPLTARFGLRFDFPGR